MYEKTGERDHYPAKIVLLPASVVPLKIPFEYGPCHPRRILQAASHVESSMMFGTFSLYQKYFPKEGKDHGRSAGTTRTFLRRRGKIEMHVDDENLVVPVLTGPFLEKSLPGRCRRLPVSRRRLPGRCRQVSWDSRVTRPRLPQPPAERNRICSRCSGYA